MNTVDDNGENPLNYERDVSPLNYEIIKPKLTENPEREERTTDVIPPLLRK
jgi:hypothetical protein